MDGCIDGWAPHDMSKLTDVSCIQEFGGDHNQQTTAKSSRAAEVDTGNSSRMGSSSHRKGTHPKSSSICETVTEFLDELANNDSMGRNSFDNPYDEGDSRSIRTSEDLLNSELSENEISILQCGLAIADISSLSSDMSDTYIPQLMEEEDHIVASLSVLDRFNGAVIPALEQDLDSIQQLMDSLEVRFDAHSKEQRMQWMQIFLASSSYSQAALQLRKDDHVKYTYQVSQCSPSDAQSLVGLLDTSALESEEQIV